MSDPEGDLKERMRAGEPVVGGWISIGHTAVAEIHAKAGLDFVLIDTEHTPIETGDVVGMVQAIEAADTGTEPIVRVPINDPVPIKQTLDTGARAIMVPLVDTAEGAREAVAATRYPPEGMRGLAGSRAAGYGLEFEEYVRTANERVLTIIQIETEEAVGNAGDIATVEGVDALFVGPADLSGNLGVFGEYDSPTFIDAVEAVIEAAHAQDVPVGTLAIGAENIHRQTGLGFDFMIAGKDASHLANGARAAADAFADAVEERQAN